MTTALSVNLNKVALVRNTRHLGIPNVMKAALVCLQAGAGGITVHSRPDERHIRADDVRELSALVTLWNTQMGKQAGNEHPNAEFNIEGNPFQNLMDFVTECQPDQATFVPDSEDQFTSDHGWALDTMGASDKTRLKDAIAKAQAAGARVSLFMDPIPSLMPIAKALGADRVELYTESFARAHGTPGQPQAMKQFADAARAAVAAGLEVNAGHDLNLQNLSDFLVACPAVKEVSIGHALIGDALEMGYTQTVQSYLHRIDVGHGLAQDAAVAACGHDHSHDGHDHDHLHGHNHAATPHVHGPGCGHHH
jgi:pyridoxine 5-phosphate synthase